MLRKIIITSLVLLVLLACSKEENASPFPEIETVISQVYSFGGVKLNGEIKNIGDEKILDYGFELFANSGNVYYNVNHQSEQPAKKGTFSVEIKHNLYPDLEYAYNAYIRTIEETYRGERLTFTSNGSATPILEKCTPNLSHVGDTISIRG
jgi:hypothetical protein